MKIALYLLIISSLLAISSCSHESDYLIEQDNLEKEQQDLIEEQLDLEYEQSNYLNKQV